MVVLDAVFLYLFLTYINAGLLPIRSPVNYLLARQCLRLRHSLCTSGPMEGIRGGIKVHNFDRNGLTSSTDVMSMSDGFVQLSGECILPKGP